MLALWVVVCTWVSLKPRTLQEKATNGRESEKETHAVVRGTRVSRYTLTPDPGNIRRKIKLGAMLVSLLENWCMEYGCGFSEIMSTLVDISELR